MYEGIGENNMMDTSKKTNSFAQLTKYHPHRPILEKALSFIPQNNEVKIAIDCGCGAGNESAYLLEQGFIVHAFDAATDAVDICHSRFSSHPLRQNIHISQHQFEHFHYPANHLSIALFSLFFCPVQDLTRVLDKITEALMSNGIFLLNLLGPEDQWVKQNLEKFSCFSRLDIKKRFDAHFKIIYQHESCEQRPLANGQLKLWHTHLLILQKK